MAIRLEQAEDIINTAFDHKEDITSQTTGEIRVAVDLVFKSLDDGVLRSAERRATGEWCVNEWVKKAILLYCCLYDSIYIGGGSGQLGWWDRFPSKLDGWKGSDFSAANFRAVPQCVIRYGAYVASRVIVMPSFINIGAYVGEGSTIDTWATVGSCAQIGKNVHLSGGAGIGGVLEPLQATPTIIEDNCFIGARSEVAEGVIVKEGAVLSMGVFVSASTKIVDRATGKIYQGEVPAYSVVVPGVLPAQTGQPALACAVIVKTVDEKTRKRTSINALLRD